MASSIELCPSQSSHCKGPISLPPEILRLVAYYLQDNRWTLHNCLLVSRAWSQAAVEYLYKAEHMMGSQDLKTLSVFPELALSFEGLILDHTAQGEEQRGSTRPQGNSPSGSPETESTPFLGITGSTTGRLRSQVMAQLFLKRTLEASLLHDDKCSYDYVSYLNKISCPWFADLIQDWEPFCKAWKGTRSRADISDLEASRSAKVDPSIARQEHCFNRMVRKVSKRCVSADEFQSSALIQPRTLIYAIRHLRNLTWMDLKDSQDLTDSVFDALSCTVHSLSYIRLPGSKMKNVSTRAVTSMILAQNKNALAQFKVIHGTNIFEDDSILKAIGERHGCSMQQLTLAICDLEHSGLQEYGPLCTKLISLNLEYTSGVTDDVLLPILETCRQLVKLDLTETDCTQATILGLSTSLDSTTPQQGRFSSLKRLILNNIDSPFTTNLFLPMADACPNLEELHVNSILADSFQDFSQFIAKTRQLKDLDIGNVFPEFSDSNLSSLVDTLPGLRWLSIANTQITDVSLVYLAENAHNLCDLCILGCDQVTKTGLLDMLDKIINKAGFRRLDITYCRLDDGAVAEIRERAKILSIDDTVNGAIEVEGDEQFADSLTEDEGEREDGEDDIASDGENIEVAVETTETEEANELVLEEDAFNSSDEGEDDDDDGSTLHGGYKIAFADVLAREEEEEEEEMSDFSDTLSYLGCDDDE